MGRAIHGSAQKKPTIGIENSCYALLSSDICDGNMLDATWQCSRALCYIGGCLFPEAYSCETCCMPICTSHMIVCFDGAVQRFWTVCMPCFDDEYGIDGVNAPSTNLFLHKVDSVPGSAAVSGDDFIREGQIGCEEIMRGSRCQRPIRWRCTRCDKQLCRMHTVFRGPDADPFCVQCVRNMSNADRVTYNRGNGLDDDHDFHHASPTLANEDFVVNAPIDYDWILKVQELFRQAADAAGSLTPSSFTALNVQSSADKACTFPSTL